MTTPLHQLEPAWAWSRYEGPWNEATAAHLLRRAGFGFTTNDLTKLAAENPAEAIHSLVHERSESAEFQQQIDAVARSVLASGEPESLASWWVYRLMHTPDQLREKMTLFWHGHFATSAEKVEDAGAMFTQNELLRQHALGNFGQLTQAIARDPAMLVYLDSVTNRKLHPNENFARELMELFCLGEGNYTERDIQQLARTFTGWEIKREKFRFNRYQHDFGMKQVFGQQGKFGGEEGVELVLAQEAAPQFIVGKLFRYFVCDEPQPTPELLAPLAKTFREHDLQIAPVLEQMFSSNLFFSEQAVARKIRSPVEMAIGLLRCLDATTNANQLASNLREVGQGLFYPPNVKGWDGGRTWINSSTLLGRANLVRELLADESTHFAGEDLEHLLDQQGAHTPQQIVDHLANRLLVVPLTPAVREELIGIVGRDKQSTSGRIAAAIYTMSSLPEFHLG
jgi:uncharacterized protein (DUF1800 family)